MGDVLQNNTLIKKLRESNEKSACIISIIALFFSVLLLILDFIRWKNGMLAESLGLSILVGIHILMFLFIVPLLNNKYKLLELKPISTFKTNAQIALFLMHITILPFVLISFYSQGRLITFAVFVLIINLFFETSIKLKLVSNFCLLLIVLVISLTMKKEISSVFLHIIEALSIIGVSFIFARHRHQNRIESDKTEQLLHNKNELLQRQNIIIEEKNNELQSFAYAASHDLKEPLRMIGSYTGLIKKRLNGHLNENTKEYMDYVVNGVSNMNQILDDLLDYATLDNNNDQLDYQNLNDVFLKVSNNLSTSIHEANAEIEIKHELPSIPINKTHASLLFQNLVGNAIKFTKKGVRPKVIIDCDKGKDNITISIKDNGIGIPKESQSKIFSIFNRLHGKDEFKGHGIGLATCKKIVEKMNGKIWVESQEGKGACFFVSFPYSA